MALIGGNIHTVVILVHTQIVYMLGPPIINAKAATDVNLPTSTLYMVSAIVWNL